MKLGIIGIGDAGRHHGRAAIALATEGACAISAVVAREPSKAEAFFRDIAAPDATKAAAKTFASIDELLAARACDAVVIATPDGLHPDHVALAAKAGVHVLVEKPLALSRAAGERAVEAARSANVHLAVGYQLRHHAAHRLVRERIGELVGPLRTIAVRWAWPDPAKDGWRARGENARFWSLAALGTHGIDLALAISNARSVTHVAGVLEPPRSEGIDRAADISFRTDTGVLVHVSTSVLHRAISRVVVSGDDGEVEALGTLGARGDGEMVHRRPRQAATSIAFTPENPYSAQLRQFLSTCAWGFADDPSLLTNLDVLDRIEP